MSGKIAALLLGITVSAIHFSVFMGLAYAALRAKVTTASAIMYAGIILRLGIVGAIMLWLVNSSYWASRIYWVTGGLIASQTVFMVIEIIFIIQMESILSRASRGVC